MSKVLHITANKESTVSSKNCNASNSYLNPSLKEAMEKLVQIYEVMDEKCNVSYDKDSNDEYNNNVLLFCGKRGQGKTTALCTFTKKCNGKECPERNNCESKCDCENNGIPKCAVLPLLSPNTLETKNDIITVILGSMLRFCDGKNGRLKSPEGEAFIDAVTKAEKTVRDIKGRNSEEKFHGNPLSEIIDKGGINELSEQLRTVVKKMLKIVDKELLIIPIDDVDLNSSRAYEIMRDLLDYMSIPKAVIVMAADFRQLEMVSKQHIYTEFKELRSAMSDSFRHEYIEQSSANFLTKLFPEHHRIHLPEIAHSEGFTIEYKNSEKCDDYVLDFPNKYKDTKTKSELPFDKQTLIFLERKTGISLTTSKDNMCKLIPLNVRELVDYLALLNSMETIFGELPSKYKDNKDIGTTEHDAERTLSVNEGLYVEWGKNLTRFEYYFVNTWAMKRLKIQFRRKFYSLLNVRIENLNHEILNKIRDIVSQLNINHTNDTNKYVKILSDILKRIKTTYSLGDVMDALVALGKAYPTEEVSYFIFAVNMLLTLRMYGLAVNHVRDKKEPLSLSELRQGHWNNMTTLENFIDGDLLGKENISMFFEVKEMATFKFDCSDFFNDTYRDTISGIIDYKAHYKKASRALAHNETIEGEYVNYVIDEQTLKLKNKKVDKILKNDFINSTNNPKKIELKNDSFYRYNTEYVVSKQYQRADITSYFFYCGYELSNGNEWRRDFKEYEEAFTAAYGKEYKMLLPKGKTDLSDESETLNNSDELYKAIEPFNKARFNIGTQLFRFVGNQQKISKDFLLLLNPHFLYDFILHQQRNQHYKESYPCIFENEKHINHVEALIEYNRHLEDVYAKYFLSEPKPNLFYSDLLNNEKRNKGTLNKPGLEKQGFIINTSQCEQCGIILDVLYFTFPSPQNKKVQHKESLDNVLALQNPDFVLNLPDSTTDEKCKECSIRGYCKNKSLFGNYIFKLIEIYGMICNSQIYSKEKSKHLFSLIQSKLENSNPACPFYREEQKPKNKNNGNTQEEQKPEDNNNGDMSEKS
jgi:hypothetical protein